MFSRFLASFQTLTFPEICNNEYRYVQKRIMKDSLLQV